MASVVSEPQPSPRDDDLFWIGYPYLAYPDHLGTCTPNRRARISIMDDEAQPLA
jgi:hypothetical protein